eukprot:6191232-Pleurochrysis_carterae.AAC.1
MAGCGDELEGGEGGGEGIATWKAHLAQMHAASAQYWSLPPKQHASTGLRAQRSEELGEASRAAGAAPCRQCGGGLPPCSSLSPGGPGGEHHAGEQDAHSPSPAAKRPAPELPCLAPSSGRLARAERAGR